MIAYVPFFDPLDWLHDWWYVLALPLSFLISASYKAIRAKDFERYWRRVIVMTIQIVLGMIALGIALLILVQWIIPALPAE